MKIYDFRIEYQKNPRGLSVRKPRFSWKMEAAERDTVQKSYCLQVIKDGKTAWDSGIIPSHQSVLVPYGGEELQEETEYRVKLVVEDNHGTIAECRSSFCTGIFDGKELKAEMITHDFPEEETACPIFYRRFRMEKKAAKAYLYATAHGVYEAAVNGWRVENDFMAPGWTSYRKRLQYQFYDITDFLREENEVAITVGNGWYKGILGFDCKPNRYGDRVAALAEIHILYEDGSRDVVATDESWKVRTGEIRYSEIYMGETIDTDEPEIREGTVTAVPFDKGILEVQESEPVRITQRIEPQKIFTDPQGRKLVDFGQNLTGLVEVKIKGVKGQKIVVRHAETLDKDGNFYPDTLRSAKSTDTYICNGTKQTFLAHFTFHGFRYIAVEGISELKPEMFTACVMHSDMEKIGDFHCSNEKVNQLQSNISWGLRDNFFDIPTDCPQRDERLGWMGDAQVFSWTAAFNRNTARFFSKWMRDIAADSSLEKGVPHVVPDIMETYSSSAWSDAAVIIPWVVYQSYGDERILEESWQCMHEWVDYIKNHTNENGLWMSGYQYGDWLALDKEETADRTGATDKYLIANAYYLYVTDLVRQTAEILEKHQEAEYYQKLYELTLHSFQEEYFTPRGRIVSETQTGCVLALYFHLAKGKDRDKILETLLTNIGNHKNHLTTGFVGTPYLCHALSENGAHETAATLFMREDYPSWLYAVNRGATTIWERWNSIMPDGSFEESGMNSLNHYAYGSIGDWMYRKIAGINQIEPGYHSFSIRPMFVKGIEEAEGSLESPYGKIVSAWSCKNKKIHIRVQVPPNTTAVIYLPEKAGILEVGSGIHEYEYDTDTCLKTERYSMDSNLGEITEQPLAVAMINQFAPGMLDNPMIEYAYGMTIAELLGTAPEGRPLFEMVIKALNEQEEQ
ncbi:MAG: glycoside hydrolase family 78 protein [Eubacteriales bacterium]|nr:glycoside hydrolase family 78 protein [Eubacteriales bacterium]